MLRGSNLLKTISSSRREIDTWRHVDLIEIGLMAEEYFTTMTRHSLFG
jgi:hypothetical protein